MKWLVPVAGALWRLALAALLACAAVRVWQLPALVDAAVQREAEATRRSLDARIASIQESAVSAITLQGALLDDRLRELTRSTDALAVGLRSDLNQQLGQANMTLAGVAGSAATLAPPLRNTLEVISENADLLGRCEGNPDCFPNRAIPALRAAERVADSSERVAASVEVITRETARVAPQATQDAAGVLSDARKITHRIASPWSVVLGVLKKLIKFIPFF